MKKKRQWFMCLGMIGVFTASVILSVFGQRKVKAQLNTENAGKITSSWADEKHIFSSFDDEKALSVDASYGFKMHATDQAEHFRTSIVSADSRQLYADLKIGTAAPTPEQLARVPHYFVGTLQLTDYYSAAQYEADVLAQLEILYQNHDTEILTGGSMMYIDAICKGIDDIPTVDNETRQLMLRRYEQEGLDTLCAELRLLDPEYYKIVDLKNPKRVIHALEICYMTGKTYTSFRTRTHKERPFHIIKIGLTRDREELYDRINRRVDIMMQDGLLEEARQVYPFRHLNSLNTVGYKEMFKYLDGEWTLEFAIGKIKQNSRIYSRKQMTWFKRDKDIVWFHPDQQTEIMQYIHSVNH